MMMQILGVAAAISYLGATLMQLRNILKGASLGQAVKALGLVGVLCHGGATFIGLEGSDGYDLGIYHMLSLMALTIAATVLASSLRRPVDNLFIVIFPIALVTIALHLALKDNYTPRTDISGGIVAHIALSVAAYSLLTIAAAQAVLLSLGDNLLRHHQLVVLRNMPPLETMEQLMFEMLWAGLIFLTLSIGSGFVYLKDITGPGLIHHTVITLAAWIVFSVLMWGRYQLGWRGAVASRWTLSGFALLVLGYFGSKLVLEVILGRG